MCTHAHTHACTRTHARTHTHTHARTHGNGGGGGSRRRRRQRRVRRQGWGQRFTIITWHRATISQRGFPHVAQATVSIRGFPQVLFAGLLRPPAMPEDDGGRPSPPDIGEATSTASSGQDEVGTTRRTLSGRPRRSGRLAYESHNTALPPWTPVRGRILSPRTTGRRRHAR